MKITNDVSCKTPCAVLEFIVGDALKKVRCHTAASCNVIVYRQLCEIRKQEK